jgi:hypothetical protein
VSSILQRFSAADFLGAENPSRILKKAIRTQEGLLGFAGDSRDPIDSSS